MKIGVTEAVLRLPSGPRDEVLPVLDDFAQYLDHRSPTEHPDPR